MGQVRILVLATVFYFFALSLGFSEILILNSGQEIEGKIIEQTDKYVKLEFQGIELVYYKNEIASVNQESANKTEGMSPQLESLYKAYTSSLKVPQKTVPSESQKIAEQPPLVSKQDTQKVQPTESTNLKERYAEVLVGGVDIDKLPPEYQEMMKAVLAKKKASNSKVSESK